MTAVDTVAEALHRECVRRAACWSTGGTRMATRTHVLSGDLDRERSWDLVEVGVRAETGGGWHVSAHRWTTNDGWEGRAFVTLAHDHDPRWSVVHAFDHADQLLVGYVAGEVLGRW